MTEPISVDSLTSIVAACDSVLTSTDNGVGYGVEDAEDNTAGTISSTGVRRQLAGEGGQRNGAVHDCNAAY